MSTPPVTPAAIAEAALALVDADGPDAVSMRRLADRLGVTAMALYNHVEDKQAVLDAVAERVLSELNLPDEHQSWQERLISLFTRLREAYLCHPQAIVLVQTAQRATPPMLAPMECALQALRDAGLSPPEALEAWAALVALTNGHTTYQVDQHLDANAPTNGPFDETELPAIAWALQEDPFDWDKAFDRAIRSLVLSISQRRHA